MRQYKFAAGVENDLNVIWDYIAQDNIDAADQWIARLFAAFESIALSPGIGHTRRDLTPAAILFWPVESYLILYRVQPETVEIIAVTQGSRDIPAFLQLQDPQRRKLPVEKSPHAPHPNPRRCCCHPRTRNLRLTPCTGPVHHLTGHAVLHHGATQPGPQ